MGPFSAEKHLGTDLDLTNKTFKERNLRVAIWSTWNISSIATREVYFVFLMEALL